MYMEREDNKEMQMAVVTSSVLLVHYGEVKKRGQKYSTLTNHFSVDFGPNFTKFGTELPQLPKNRNKHKYLKQIFYK